MIGTLLQRRSHGQRTVAREACHNLRQLGFADRQRAGLIKRHHSRRAGRFQRDRIADQDAVLRTDSGADHDRCRRREAERARAGDHQHRDGVQDCRRPALSGDQPAHHGQHRDHQHHRNEHSADLVNQTLDRRLGALRLRHHAHDPAQHRFGADGRHAHQQQPVAVDRAADHMVLDLDVHRPTLAGQQRLVDRGAALHHHAVGSDARTRLHHQQIADAQCCDRHGHILSVPPYHGLDRAQGFERFQRLERAALGTRLQPLAEPHQHNDDGRGFEIEMNAAARHQIEAEPEGRAGAQRHQHVHVRGAAAQRFPRTLIERRTQPELHRRGQRQLPPSRQHEVTAGEIHYHRRDQRQRQHGADQDRDQLALQLAPVFGDATVIHRPRAVAGLGDRSLDSGRRDAGVAIHLCDLGGEVDVGGGDAGDALQHALDPPGAGGAGHAGDADGEVPIRPGRRNVQCCHRC